MPGKNAPTYRMKGFSGFGNDKKQVKGITKNYSNTPVMDNSISLENRKEGFNTVKTNKKGEKIISKKLTDKEVSEYRKNNPNKRNNKLTPKQKAVKGGMPLEVAEEIGIPRSGIKKGFLGKVGKVLGAGVLSGLPRYGKHSKGMPKTYKEAYATRGEKYKDMDEATYIKEAKSFNKKEYGTENPSTRSINLHKEGNTEKLAKRKAAQAKKDATGVDKKRNEANAKKKAAAKNTETKRPKVGDFTKEQKAKGKLVVNQELMKNAKKNQRVSNATVTEKKKPIGPKERTTVKKAKATKKASVKNAKQKSYETRKDRRAAVSDARKSGRAGVKEARKDKRDLKKAEKNTRKRDKKEVKAAITDAKRAAKIDKLKSKKSTNKRSNKIDDLQAKRKLNSDEPLARYKNASQRKAAHASMNEKKKK